jgi:hypothetical protein
LRFFCKLMLYTVFYRESIAICKAVCRCFLVYGHICLVTCRARVAWPPLACFELGCSCRERMRRAGGRCAHLWLAVLVSYFVMQAICVDTVGKWTTSDRRRNGLGGVEGPSRALEMAVDFYRRYQYSYYPLEKKQKNHYYTRVSISV